MAGSRLIFEVDDREALGALDRLRGAVDDMSVFFADVGEYLQLAHRARWELEVAPDGTPWEGLDPEYAARKPRRRDQILVLEGDLRDQLRHQVQGGELLFGTSLIYGATHQFGDPARGIPQRPWLGVSDDDRDHILSLALAHLQSATRG